MDILEQSEKFLSYKNSSSVSIFIAFAVFTTSYYL